MKWLYSFPASSSSHYQSTSIIISDFAYPPSQYFNMLSFAYYLGGPAKVFYYITVPINHKIYTTKKKESTVHIYIG